MKLLITGDLAITQPYDASTKIDKGVIDLFADSDINIVNLEIPVTDNNSKIIKFGPNLKAYRESVMAVLKVLNVHIATLANNHLTDYAEQGVADTLAFCKEHDIMTVGGGMNLNEAAQTLYLNSPEGKIAIVNFAENEWTPATPTSAGFNPMDIIDNTRQIKEAKNNADYVIVIIHGGHEYYNLPSPRMVKQYRFYAEQGADVIVGHHTHCISGNEVYNGIPIYYSLGNFLFTHKSTNEDWYIGTTLEIIIKDGKIGTKLYPIRQNKGDFQLSLCNSIETNEILSRINSFNTIIQDEQKKLNEWNKFLCEKSKTYLNHLSLLAFINNRYIKALLRKLNIKLYNRKSLSIFLNLISCEAHRDMSKSIIDNYLDNFRTRSKLM